MRRVQSLRRLTVSGALLATMATALVASGAAAAPGPSGPVTPAPAEPVAWSAPEPPALHRVVVRPPAQRTSRTVQVARRNVKTDRRSVKTDRRSPLQRAVARIPGYRQHRPAVWVLSSKYGNYGVTDWYHNTVYISPHVPTSRLDDVVRHEWGHILSVRAYGGSVASTIAGLDRRFGGSGLTGAERAADCVATVLGAHWRHYTSCSNQTWQRQAEALLDGRRP